LGAFRYQLYDDRAIGAHKDGSIVCQRGRLQKGGTTILTIAYIDRSDDTNQLTKLWSRSECHNALRIIPFFWLSIPGRTTR